MIISGPHLCAPHKTFWRCLGKVPKAICLPAICSWRIGLRTEVLHGFSCVALRDGRETTESAAQPLEQRHVCTGGGRRSHSTCTSAELSIIPAESRTISPSFAHTHKHTCTSTCSTHSPAAPSPPATAPFLIVSWQAPLLPPYSLSRVHSQSAGWSCRPGGSPAGRGPASARGPCREPATRTTTASTRACCPATGNKTCRGSRRRSVWRWRWPVSCAWWAHKEGTGGEPAAGSGPPGGRCSPPPPPVMGWTCRGDAQPLPLSLLSAGDAASLLGFAHRLERTVLAPSLAPHTRTHPVYTQHCRARTAAGCNNKGEEVCSSSLLYRRKKIVEAKPPASRRRIRAIVDREMKRKGVGSTLPPQNSENFRLISKCSEKLRKFYFLVNFRLKICFF